MTYPLAVAAIGILLWLGSPTLAQLHVPKDSKTITTCQFELTPHGRAANFRFIFKYLLQAEPDGTISKIQQILNSQRDMKTKFVNDDLFKDCVSQWKLRPAGRYYVSFYVGTTSIGVGEGLPLNYVTILGPEKLTIIFELAAKRNDLVEVKK